MTSPTRPVDVEGLRSRVDAELRTFMAEQAASLEVVDPSAGELVGAVGDLVRAGKRLRPAFCYWGWRGAGGAEKDPSIIRAAAALELFHAAALIHDDLMDGSDTRRGMPAAHRRFSALHRQNGWQGDDERFGLSGAVLAGDICLAWADEMLARCGIAPARLMAGSAVFHRMRTELVGGQYLDVLTQSAPPADPFAAADRARLVIRYKSAKYSIEHPLLLGGTLAGANEALLNTYSAYGLALGEAFQLRDDVLGVFGDPGETGKPAGDDLREGKRTVLIALALQRAQADEAALIKDLLGDPLLDSEGVHALHKIIVGTGALDEVERMIEQLSDQAHAALDGDLVQQPAHDLLGQLVTASTTRVH
jgi:geranylgeranyl diphosphate synthase type I